MKNVIARTVRKLRSLHRDEQGAEMLEYVLVFAAIALPLIGIILYFRNEIAEWARSLWEDTKTDAEDTGF